MRTVDPADLHRISSAIQFGFASEARARRRLLLLCLAKLALLIAYAPWWASAVGGVVLVVILVTIARDSFEMDRLQMNIDTDEK